MTLKCTLCGPISHNVADFEISYGALDSLLRVCRYCREDLDLFGFHYNQVIRLPRVQIPHFTLLEILGPVFSLLEARA